MIQISKILPIQNKKDEEHSTFKQNTGSSKEIDPEQSVFFNTLKPMLTPEALAAALRKEQ